MSSTPVIGAAPSFSRLFGPSLWCERMLPGTANTSRPCCKAKRAVIIAPDFMSASTMTTPRTRPLMIRLRGGKLAASGPVPSA